jgi:hypothetical protein
MCQGTPQEAFAFEDDELAEDDEALAGDGAPEIP